MQLPESGNDSPLSFALVERDRDTIALVKRALERRTVLLAYQPIVQASNPNRVAFYEGLIRIMDDTGRILPARDFIGAVEGSETGRIIDCLALEMGLRPWRKRPRFG
ncbi:EAL domain protein [mine drainage metagenome]|uniref:EAL domain protein n=1 Tax=mine drainage metagenome TaxID=410659 RepID=A0A1J5QPA7_9ZZZZ